MGNQSVLGYYDYTANITTSYYALGLPATAAPTAVPNSLPNPDIRWEQTKQWNAGFDYQLFNGKITGSFDYYEKTTEDMLLVLTIPYYIISFFLHRRRSNDTSASFEY